MNILFVCEMGQIRGPTAAQMYSGEAQTKFAGASKDSKYYITQDLVDWADCIFCMEYDHYQHLVYNFHRIGECRVLEIPDDYGYMDPALVRAIQKAVDPQMKQL